MASAAPTLTAITALWKREIVKFARDRSRLFGAIAQPLGFWVLLGLGFHSSFALPATAGPEVSYMEFLFPGILVLIVLFTAIFSTISIVEERQRGFLQAALVAPIARATLVFGNALGGTTLALVQALLFLLLLPFLDVGTTAAGLAVITLTCLLTGLAFTALGFTIAWRMETTRGFHAIMNLFLLPMWFLSGAFFPPEGAAPLLQAVMAINPVTYAVSAMRLALFPDAHALLGLTGCLLVSTGFALAMLAVATWTVRRPLYGAS